jgi:hypothetical protein
MQVKVNAGDAVKLVDLAICLAYECATNKRLTMADRRAITEFVHTHTGWYAEGGFRFDIKTIFGHKINLQLYAYEDGKVIFDDIELNEHEHPWCRFFDSVEELLEWSRNDLNNYDEFIYTMKIMDASRSLEFVEVAMDNALQDLAALGTEEGDEIAKSIRDMKYNIGKHIFDLNDIGDLSEE